MERNHEPFYSVNIKDNIDYDKLSRSDYETFKSFDFDEDTINECINEIMTCHCNNDIDRTNMYLKSVINRIKKCDELYLRELDEELEKFHRNFLGDDCSVYSLAKIIKLSARLSADIFDNYMNILVSLCN